MLQALPNLDARNAAGQRPCVGATRRPPGWPALGPVLVVALLLLAYWDTLGLLTTYWASNDMYSYGFLVPVISAFMFWLRRDEVRTADLFPNPVAGAVVSACGLAALQFGRSSATNLIQETSLVVTVVGLVLLLAGWPFLRRFWFPVTYLLAMIPFWDFLTSGIQPFFQVYSAAIGVSLLKLLGIPVFHDGFLIDLPNVRLEVAEACSGVNNLIAVMCIGVPATLLLITRSRTRFLILFTAAGIALISNGVRVAVVCLFAYKGLLGVHGDIHGPYALFRSLLISGVGFLVLFALIFRFADKAALVRASPDIVRARSEPRQAAIGYFRLWPIAVAVLMLCAALAVQRWHPRVSAPLAVPLSEFPSTIGPWRSDGPAALGAAFEAIQFDDLLSRDYRTGEGRVLNLRIGYLQHQGPGKKLAGWDMAKIFGDRHGSASTVEYAGLRMNEVLQDGAGGGTHFTYWYIVGTTDLDRDYRVRLLSGLRSLFLGRSNGTLIVITRHLADSERLESSRAIIGAFIDALLPVVRRQVSAR